MAAPRPLPPTPPGLLDDEDPGKWERVKQALWETNLNAPVRGIYNMMNADPYTLYTDTGAAGQQAVADSFDAAGGVTAGSAMIPKPSNAMAMGIKAYHGSPHSFDKFSMDKIGTGEGAQAYGHGLYFAEKEGIAKSYRDALTPKDYILNAPEAEVSARHGQDIVDTFVDHGGDRNELQATIVRLKNQNNRDLMELGVSDASQINPPNDWGIEANVIRRSDRIKRLEGLLSSDDVKINPGSMYEVNIDADPNAFLDWDKPLSEQPEYVRKAYAKAAAGNDPLLSELLDGSPESLQLTGLFSRSSGAQAYNTFTHGNKEAATQALRDAGIPGIKYLDAGSRVTPRSTFNAENAYWDAYAAHDKNPTSETKATLDTARANWDAAKSPPSQTRNYVVFDDSLIDIIKKYGIAGLLGSGGMYGMSADEAQAGAR